jgi:hypothetical protein
MNERILTLAVHQTGNCTAQTDKWSFAFPFPTRLMGVKHSGSNASKTSTFAVGGGAAIAATTIAASGNPTYTQPTTEPDYVDAGTAYTLTFVAGTAIDDPMLVFVFEVGEGGTYAVEPGERIVAIPIYQTGTQAAAAYTLEFPMPVKYIGNYSCDSNAGGDTIAISGGAVDAATALSVTQDTPVWNAPTTAPDYVAADTAIVATLAGTTSVDPFVLLFFALGEGGTNWRGMTERTQCVSLIQTGAATTGGWVYEFPFSITYRGHKGCASATSATTITLAGGVVDAAAAIGASGDPIYSQPTSVPDYCAEDTAITITLTQSATRGDDPLVVSFFDIGEGGIP